tara:strand:+ start:1135 stop:3540 length:2406 start_codon:yes stop_codon:yes gene_type:complete
MLKRTNTAAIANAEVACAVNIPYQTHITDDTILTDDGDLIRIYRFSGTPVKTADDDDVNAWFKTRHNMLASVKSSKVAIWSHVVKKKAVFNNKTLPSNIAGTIISEYETNVLNEDMFTTEFYFTVVYRPSKTGLKLLDFIRSSIRKGKQNSESLKIKLKKEIVDFNRVCTEMVGRLSIYEPIPLKTYQKNQITYSECLSFLSYLVEGKHREIPLFPSKIKNFLVRERINFKRGIGSVQNIKGDETFFTTLGIREHINNTHACMLDAVLELPFEMIVSQSFCFMSRAEAIAALKLQKGHLEATEDDARTMIDDLDFAINDLSAGVFGMGHHDLTILVKSDNPKTLGDYCANICESLDGVDLVREDLVMESSFWSMLPGNFPYITRSSPITTENFADFSSFHGMSLGRRKSHWGKPLTIFKTDSNTPYNFHLHVGELGHSTFIGPSRSGKTTLMTFIMMLLEQNNNMEQVYFDKDFGAEPTVLSLGGAYTVIKNGVSTGFNPLLLEPNEANQSYLFELFKFCAYASDETFTISTEETLDLSKAIKSTMTHPDKSLRRLSILVNYLNGRSRLKEALSNWVDGNTYSWVFDNEDDSLTLNGRIFGYDMTEVLDNPVVKGVISNYIVKRHTDRLDGRRTAYYFDEGWKLIDDNFWAAKIEDIELTIGKSNGVTMFATQMPKHVLESKAGKVILEQSATNIFAGNPKATKEEYMTGFGLSEREFDLVKNKLPGQRKYLIKKAGEKVAGSSNGESVVVEFNLQSMMYYMPLLSNIKSNVEKYRTLIDQHGSAPEAWVQRFLDKVNNNV